jgi:hypothetical protein
VQDHAAQQLDVEMAQADRTPRGLAAQGEGLGQDLV